MVGFVIVSHSETLANGVVELTKMMADGVPIRAAGGLDGGGFGTKRTGSVVSSSTTSSGVVAASQTRSRCAPLCSSAVASCRESRAEYACSGSPASSNAPTGSFVGAAQAYGASNSA